ncbi:MAG: alkaline phosphatase family protein [Chloroflexota bacterium]
MAIRPWPAAILLLLAILAGAAGSVAGARRGHPPTSRVVLIVLENHEYGEVAGSPEAPYLNRLARRETLIARYHAVAHPSLPNYLAMLGGSTFGIADDCTECSAHGSNLALQLSRAGVSWRAYMEGMPRPCFGGAQAGGYVKRHDPFMYFPSIAANPHRCANVVPTRRLRTDLKRRSLPAFAWIGPDLCYSAHNCNLATADRHLSKLVPRIMRKLGRDGTLIVAFDEGRSNAGGGGHVFTVIAHPGRQRAKRLTATYNHYSLLAAIERHFGLPLLRAAQHARALPLGR